MSHSSLIERRLRVPGSWPSLASHTLHRACVTRSWPRERAVAYAIAYTPSGTSGLAGMHEVQADWGSIYRPDSWHLVSKVSFQERANLGLPILCTITPPPPIHTHTHTHTNLNNRHYARGLNMSEGVQMFGPGGPVHFGGPNISWQCLQNTSSAQAHHSMCISLCCGSLPALVPFVR